MKIFHALSIPIVAAALLWPALSSAADLAVKLGEISDKRTAGNLSKDGDRSRCFMKILRSIPQAVCLLVSSIFLGACSPLGSLQPLGEKAVVLKPESINGDWVSNGGHLKLLVTDATNGTALAAWIEEENGDLKMKRLKLVVRQTGETTLVNVRFLDETNEVYMVGRGKLSDNTLVFWPGNKDALKQSVGAGKLSIVATNDTDIIISTNFQQAAEFLASPAGKTMFDLEEPLVLTRMPR